MSKPKPRAIKLVVILFALSVVLSGVISTSRAAAPSQDLPESKGVQVVREQCLSCHEADLIVQQRLTRAGWTREIDKMIRWGATVSATERDPMLDYLATHFGPRPATAASNQAKEEASGELIFQTQCMGCHEDDLTRQQRLTRAGWTREVDKMIRWGATVSAAEKELLLDYLAKNFGPQKK